MNNITKIYLNSGIKGKIIILYLYSIFQDLILFLKFSSLAYFIFDIIVYHSELGILLVYQSPFPLLFVFALCFVYATSLFGL